MAKKAPRQTAQRILTTALALFNRFGEPQVSTTLIATELGISPGNLYYHYPAKDALVNALFERYTGDLYALLAAAGQVRDVEDAWFLLHSLFELNWQYRFLYRDLNHLLSRNRHLETGIRELVAHEVAAARSVLAGLRHAGSATLSEQDLVATANCLVVVLSYWLSFEYVRDPRHALEPEHGQSAALQGAHHALGLLAPFLTPAQRTHLHTLQDAYTMPVD
jgi:AcrR family transcriptional regulator